MYDPKTIRRRRAVLALLVLGCLVLLTASFGSGGGAMGAVQRGVFEIVSPIQDGASRALSPVRNLFGWVSDTWHAKGDVKDLRDERDDLRASNAELQAKVREDKELRGLLKLDAKAQITDLGLVTARITATSPSVFQQRFTINRGTSDGVKVDQPVVGGGGLVGKVTKVTGGYSVVTLITDQSVGVAARSAVGGVTGQLSAAPGSPRDLEFKELKSTDVIENREMIVTRGTDSPNALPSLFPADIPIGYVYRVDDRGSDTQVAHVRPYVNPRKLTYVQVITRPAPAGNQ